jgi:polysaccharide biosynthesis/export protein
VPTLAIALVAGALAGAGVHAQQPPAPAGAAAAGAPATVPAATTPASPAGTGAAPDANVAPGTDVTRGPLGPAPSLPTSVPVAPEYRIGPGDVLGIVFWREKELSGEVAVRPDGLITLPLMNDIYAAGLTPDELRQKVANEAKRFVTDPTASVVVRQINSRVVYITGEVLKAGTYPMYGPMRVLQLIAAAGGLREYADKSNIVVVRNENGTQTSLMFNYDEVRKQRKLGQNIELQPGDTVVVP